MLAPPTIASQTDNPSSPSRSARGREQAKRARRGCPFKVRANGLLPGTRLSASLDGRGYSTSKRGESSDDEEQSFRCSPEGRRSGDVGGAGLLTDFHNQLIDAIPKDAAMLRETTRRTKILPERED